MKFIGEEQLIFTTFVGRLQVASYITNCCNHTHKYIYIYKLLIYYDISGTWVPGTIVCEYNQCAVCYFIRAACNVFREDPMHFNREKSSKLHLIRIRKFMYACLYIKCLIILQIIWGFCKCEDPFWSPVDTGTMQSGSCYVADYDIVL